MLKNYLKYSGLWAGFVLNPYHWNFKLEFKPYNMDEISYIFFFELYIGPVWLRAIVDDGSW